MPRVDLPFPDNSSPGVRPEEGGGRVVNAYITKNDHGARTKASFRRSPGLLRVANVSAPDPARGLLRIPKTAYYTELVLSAVGDQLYQIDGDYAVTALGTIISVGQVTMAQDYASPIPNMVMCTAEGGVMVIYPTSAPTIFADPDLPPNPTSVTNHRGVFLWTYRDGTIYASDRNSTDVDPLAFTHGAGAILRGVSYGADYIAYGDSFFEIYRDVGTTPFPLQFVDRVHKGIVGTYAIAGFEPGGPNFLAWAADDNTVRAYNGSGDPPIISTEDVARSIQSVPAAGRSDIEAHVYSVEGFSFWVLSYPGFWTWEYCVNTKTWNERQSGASITNTGLISWVAGPTVWAFGKWHAALRETGHLCQIDSSTFDEDGQTFVFQVETGNAVKFPSRLGAPRLDVDISTGTTTSAVADPTLYTSWSNDGGATYGNEVSRSLVYGRDSVTYWRTGDTRGRGKRYRFRVSDPVYVRLMGASFVGGPESPDT